MGRWRVVTRSSSGQPERRDELDDLLDGADRDLRISLDHAVDVDQGLRAILDSQALDTLPRENHG
jgi:hypothetical protein